MNATDTKTLTPAEIAAAALDAISAEPTGWAGLGWDRITIAQALGCTIREAKAALRVLAADGRVWTPRTQAAGLYALAGHQLADLQF